MRRTVRRAGAWLVSLAVLIIVSLPDPARAATAQQIDASVTAALARFTGQVTGAGALLGTAKGVLVFPGVVKVGAGVGAGVGGEYGEGALRVRGRTVAYYSYASASVGLQLGIQQKDIIIVFLQDRALAAFRAKGPNAGWQVGADGSVVVADVGVGGAIDTARLNQPIVAFVVGRRGLMINITLEGAKITRLAK